MKLIIGLGNPGTKYKNNRHNAGHKFVDRARGSQFTEDDVKFIKTDVFMNESGGFVRQRADFYKIDLQDLYIVHDDLDLPLESYKIQLGIGPKVHYGIQSVERGLGTKGFWRIRIGVDNRDPSNRMAGEDYVLRDFTEEEMEILEGVFDAIIKDSSFPR